MGAGLAAAHLGGRRRGGVGHLLVQQLAAAGERVLDVPPQLAARVRLLATGDVNKNDPNDARSVAVGADEAPLGQVRVRASAAQAQRLLAWAAAWPERSWAVEGARGMGHLLAQQLLAAGEPILRRYLECAHGARSHIPVGRQISRSHEPSGQSTAEAGG